MGMLNWSSIRRRIIDRDDETCQHCGYDHTYERRARRRDELKERYGDPYEHDCGLEVDHIIPVSEGGHPFDPANLQTLCTDCHKHKTARENSERGTTPSREDINKSLFAYVSDGGRSLHLGTSQEGRDDE
jgi:5-methylcytosine-specific restriction endonuclease McrA